MKWLIILSLFFTLPAYSESQILKQIIKEVAKKNGIDPNLAVAIAQVESSFNKDKEGKLGEKGLFQLRPEFHEFSESDVYEQIEVAIKYLKYVQKHCEGIYDDAWFICYNTGPFREEKLKEPKKFIYYTQVMFWYKIGDF